MSLLILSFGSNIGDCKANIKKCYSLLEAKFGVPLITSSFYETKPWGKTDQPNFINSAGYCNLEKKPLEILPIILETEQEIGRIRTEKWGPRVIDIDILFIDNEVIKLDELIVPHPFIQERAFVLEPLAEILPNYIHPTLKKDINTLFLELNQPKSA